MENPLREKVQKSYALRQKRKNGRLIQDVGILLLILSMFFAVISSTFAPDYLLVPELIMFAAACAGLLLAAYSFRYLAVIEAGLQVLIFVAYILFRHRVESMPIHWSCYAWVFLPLLGVGAMLLFQAMNYRNEQMNQILMQQMDDLVLIHPLTGLYNARALYLDLQRQMAYASRRKVDLCLMCIELRYGGELQKILTTSQFSQLLQTLAHVIENALRLEDKVYMMDDDGSMALILGCSAEGAMVVKNRIKDTVAKSELFHQIVNQALRVDLRIGFLQYDSNAVSSAMEFQQKVKNELQYDV